MSVIDQNYDAPTLPSPEAVLTAREVRLLEWLALGRSNVQIGRCAGRSEKTVRNQLTSLYAKLGAANRAEAVALWLRGA